MKPTQLLDKPPREPRVLLQLLPLRVVRKQRDDTQGDHVDHGRVAGDEEEERNLHDVGFREVAGDQLLGDEFADEVGGGGGEGVVD